MIRKILITIIATYPLFVYSQRLGVTVEVGRSNIMGVRLNKYEQNKAKLYYGWGITYQIPLSDKSPIDIRFSCVFNKMQYQYLYYNSFKTVGTNNQMVNNINEADNLYSFGCVTLGVMPMLMPSKKIAIGFGIQYSYLRYINANEHTQSYQTDNGGNIIQVFYDQKEESSITSQNKSFYGANFLFSYQIIKNLYLGLMFRYSNHVSSGDPAQKYSFHVYGINTQFNF